MDFFITRAANDTESIWGVYPHKMADTDVKITCFYSKENYNLDSVEPFIQRWVTECLATSEPNNSIDVFSSSIELLDSALLEADLRISTFVLVLESGSKDVFIGVVGDRIRSFRWVPYFDEYGCDGTDLDADLAGYHLGSGCALMKTHHELRGYYPMIITSDTVVPSLMGLVQAKGAVPNLDWGLNVKGTHALVGQLPKVVPRDKFKSVLLTDLGMNTLSHKSTTSHLLITI